MPNNPIARVPQIPFNPCTGTAPTGSSILNLSNITTPNTTITPATAPIIIAAHGSTNAHGAVIATRPASAPFIAIDKSGFPNIRHTVIIAKIPPRAAAKLVFMATLAIRSPFPTPKVDPGLKPNHPNQRINTPSDAKGIECPAMTFVDPSGLYFPALGLNIIVPIKAALPPTRCTTVEPAKSAKPKFASQPPPHIQCPTIG